jgi:hypothetical protein
VVVGELKHRDSDTVYIRLLIVPIQVLCGERHATANQSKGLICDEFLPKHGVGSPLAVPLRLSLVQKASKR